LEGIGWLFRDALIPNRIGAVFSSVIDYGPLNIFSAALLATDISLGLPRSLFQLAWLLKLLYPLFNMSCSIYRLISRDVSGLHLVWLGLRLPITLLWVLNCLEEFVWWKERPISAVEAAGMEFDNSTNDETSGSRLESRLIHSWGD
jgi:hypothetical protein